MTFHCDKCGKELGTYLFGKGGVEERAWIAPFMRKELNKVSLPDMQCFDCYKKNHRLSGTFVTEAAEKESEIINNVEQTGVGF
jgi:hypothetical protein